MGRGKSPSDFRLLPRVSEVGKQKPRGFFL